MYTQYNNLCQFGLLSQAYQPISPSILIHFWWELYHFLSWTIPTHLVMGSLHGPMTLMRDLPLILTLMSLGLHQRAIQTISILDDSSSTLTPCPSFMANQHEFRTYQHAVNHEAPDNEKFRPYFGWVNVDTVQKTMEQSTQLGVSLPNKLGGRELSTSS